MKKVHFSKISRFMKILMNMSFLVIVVQVATLGVYLGYKFMKTSLSFVKNQKMKMRVSLKMLFFLTAFR